MFIIFCISQLIAGFCLLVFGVGMIESPDTITMLLGSMFAFVGIILIVMYGKLLNAKLKGEIF